MLKKVILQGNLAFGKARSFEQVMKMLEHRMEVYYKSGLLIDEENFHEDGYTLLIPRVVIQCIDKQFKNTVDLLQYVSQFALSGEVRAWMLDDGKLLEYHLIEPENDKAAVQAFIRGKELIGESGKEEEAIAHLTKAINKHDEHSQAYERRGYVNYILQNYEDAIYDFTKAIKMDPSNAEPYLGRAKVAFIQGNLDKAIEDADCAVKKAIAWQPTYWIGRRMKAECFIKQKEWKKAEFELKLFTNRKFEETNPNFLWKKWAYFQYGNVLLKLEDFDGALKAHNMALSIEEGHGKVSKAEQLANRGIAIQKSGGSGYLSDWKEAAQMGSDLAKNLLEQHS